MRGYSEGYSEGTVRGYSEGYSGGTVGVQWGYSEGVQ